MEAIKHFQIASLNPLYKSLALRKSSECFWELGLKTASTSADRQSREQYLDYEARHVLFTLARNYEDNSQWGKAKKLFELLIAWDIDFRNAVEKHRLASGYSSKSSKTDININKDYTGSTVNLLGSEYQSTFNNKLKNVIEARNKEILITHAESSEAKAITIDLLSDKEYSRGIKKDIGMLGYDQRLFLKYDYGLPQDEMKKFLETVNAYKFFIYAKELSKKPLSLDIGSATGRYPTLLKRLGFQSYGIDIEQAAISYSNEKKGSTEEWPKYICGNAIELDKHINGDVHFQLITCMMGTFEHISKKQQSQLVKKLYSKLEVKGVCVISVWDTECPHLAYLSIYDEGQKQLIRENSSTKTEMNKMFKTAGFKDVQIIPFALMPHTFIYDVGIENFQDEDVEIATQADLAARALFKDRHGEMFLIIGMK